MTSLVIILDPAKLEHPDLDLRYAIPDLLHKLSEGNIEDNGYDYEEWEGQEPLLAIFLKVKNLEFAVETIRETFWSQRILENDVSKCATLYIENGMERNAIELW